MNSVRPSIGLMDEIISGELRVSSLPSSYVNWAIDYLNNPMPKVEKYSYQQLKHFIILHEACCLYSACMYNLEE